MWWDYTGIHITTSVYNSIMPTIETIPDDEDTNNTVNIDNNNNSDVNNNKLTIKIGLIINIWYINLPGLRLM